MALKPQCVQAVNQAAGRTLSDAELKGIEDRLSSTMRRLATADPPRWRTLTMEQRVTEASKAAMQDMRAEATRKLANAQRQVVATAATQQRLATLRQLRPTAGASRALVEEITNTSHYADGVKREAVSHLMDLVDAAASTDGASTGRKVLQYLFDAENPAMTRDLVAEIFGNGKAGTGNAMAKAGAEAWLKVIEGLRKRFNAAGGDVGKLMYGYLPQAHDSARVRSVGRQKWIDTTLPLLDRKQYVKEDGSMMADSELVDMLDAAYDTLATDGLNKQTPGQFKGTGARANRGSDSRVLHFKDGESYLAYNKQFGLGSMYDAMVAHVGGIARDIALVERYGPNPNQQFRLQNDLALQADNGAKRIFGHKTQAYWDLLTGTTASPESARLAAIGQTSRNLQTFSKLGAAVISSITDLGSLFITTGYNKLPYWELLKNTARMTTQEGREFATAHAVIADSMINDLNRWAGENIRNTWSGRLANSTMRLSLMNAWTDTLRRGFSLTMMQGLGRMAGKRWDDLTEWDRTHLERKGITADDWAVVNQARLTSHDGATFLTPEAIAAADIQLARPQDLQRIRDQVQAQTGELSARNAQELEWIAGRIDKFDDARDSMNRAIKELRDKKLAKNEQATEALLQRMALLEEQRDQAQLQAQLESEYNRLFTKADVDAFERGMRSAGADLNRASSAAIDAADRAGEKFGQRRQRIEARMRDIQSKATGKAGDEGRLQRIAIQAAEKERAALERDIEVALKAYPQAERQAFQAAMESFGDVRRSARDGIASAEVIGRRYGEQKGRLQRRMQELENRIAEMDRQTGREMNVAAKEAQAKADAMREELAAFIKRSQERQARRQAVIQRLQAQEAPRLAAEAERIKNEVTAKILGFITDESEYAVINPDLATRAWSTGGGAQAGTVKGELARSVMQFKSFPIAMISRHWRRMLEAPAVEGAPMIAGGKFAGRGVGPVTVNRLAYTAALVVTTTALGAIAFQIKQMIQGKDPVDMTTAKFWSRAAAQGGGAGFLGDILLGDTTDARSPLDNLGRLTMGPTFGSLAELYELTKGNIDEAIAGKDTHVGAEALRFGRNHAPFVNLWYARAAVDHMLMHSLQENLSPGYLARQRQRAAKEWKQGYWWEPGELAPDRAPDLSAIGGP